MSVHKIEHIGIYVSALEDSIEFYIRVLNLKHLYTLGEVEDDVRLAFMGFQGQDSVEIELIWKKDAPDLASEGRVNHLAFTVSHIEQEYSRIAELGLSGRSAQIQSLSNGSRYFFFNGPDGERIEFFEPARLTP
ncbi:lactoylglutathione lyase [Paenibacillus shirakamiensis]|uniref:Lactoylglutathione lyase n=1 Tax=Paenibacillus shirakamiensis TaxID=1265935 RepID=A0ABS4JIS1_9BACL|nr:VOC family protein [Paenibacillus shirakamiensis]MBP2000504.1 lactoylglutathione lyase [Paenibacillus shirakamiensis]